MNSEFKFSSDANIFVTSDTHFNHDKDFIWKDRGFSSIADHNKKIIQKINDVVAKDDVLIHCGDWCLNTKIEDIRAYHDTLNCDNIYLLWGNHNNPLWKAYLTGIESEYGRSDIEVYPFNNSKYLPKFTFVGNLFQFYWRKKLYICSHFPLLIWDKQRHGTICLTGHSHNNCPQTNLSNTENKILDVGWDVHGKPVHLTDINRILQSRKIVIKDHHGNS